MPLFKGCLIYGASKCRSLKALGVQTFLTFHISLGHAVSWNVIQCSIVFYGQVHDIVVVRTTQTPVHVAIVE